MTRIAVDDGVRYEVREGGAGPALLLLHGFAGRSAIWAPFEPAFRARHRTIAVDLLGHGGSDRPSDPARHAVERQAADLAALLERVGAVPAAVVGYSFGARIALRLALDHPATVERLLLESPSAGVPDPAARAARREADERWATLIETGGIEAFADAWEAQPLFASRHRLPDDERRRWREIVVANRPGALAASLRGAGQGAMEPLLERLPQIRQPTLVVAGALDEVGLGRAREIAGRLPNARLEIVPDAGHAPHLEAPVTFRRVVVEFLMPAVEVAP